MATISVQTKKFGDLETATTASDDSLLLIHDGNGVKTMTAANLQECMLYNNAGAHNSVYRGKYLGSSVTDEQYAAISAGTFEDLYIGDYWTINGVNWRIAAFNYYYNKGNVAWTTNHVVIIPGSNLYTAQMNSTATTTGGYLGSEMHTANLETAKTTINNAFGSDHVLPHPIYLTNAVSNRLPSGGEWATVTVELMNSYMVFGSGMLNAVADSSIIPHNFPSENTILPLFLLTPSAIRTMAWWLRDVVSDSSFSYVTNTAREMFAVASSEHGVRPVFCIG